LDIALSLAFGLLTATGFGTADFVAKLSTNRVGFLRTALFMQIIGSVLLLPFAFNDVYRLFLQPWAIVEGMMLGVVNALATLSLYKGFEVGRLSIVSPIASSYPVVSILLAVSFLGERLTTELLLGIGLVIVGIILVSIQTEQEKVRKRLTGGVAYAIGYMVLGGVLFFGLKPVSQALGVYLPVLLLRWVSAFVLVIAFFALKPRGVTRLNAFSLIIAVAIFDTFANVAYNVGVSFGTVSIVSTIGGLFSAVTILLARFFLKEKLTRHQMVGFLTITAGVAILGFFA